MKFKVLFLMLVVSVVTLVPQQAAAQAGSEGWQFSIAPYLWAAGMDGTMTIADQEADFDVPFGDIIKNLDLAFMGHFDMRNERWVVASDLIFVNLEDTQDLANGSVTAGIDLTLVEVVVGYRLSPAVALLAGARWVDMGGSLLYSGQIVEPAADVGKSWIDPLVGVHVLTPLSERWWFGLHGDVGGFGVGSELTWQAYADIGWKASDMVSIILGYRAIDIDYEDGDGLLYVGLDVLMSGPQLGVVFSF